MLKKFVGGFAFLVFTFSFSIPGFIEPEPANADPDLIYYYRTRLIIKGRGGVVCGVYTVNETETWTTTSHSIEHSRELDGTHRHPVSGNTPSNRIPRERTEYIWGRC